jgi:hypothetical protein
MLTPEDRRRADRRRIERAFREQRGDFTIRGRVETAIAWVAVVLAGIVGLGLLALMFLAIAGFLGRPS